MGSSKGDWLMNNRLDFFKRITAFLLVLLLVTTMMGDDFFSLATSDEIITEESTEGTDANAEPDDTSVPKTVDVVTEPVEGEEPGTAEITEEASPVQPELQEASETPADNEPVLDENGNPIITEEQPIPETPEKTDESNNDEIKTPEPEKIDVIVENDKKDDLAEEDENKEQPAVDGENKEEVIEGEEKDPTKEEVDKDKDKEKPEEENNVCEHKWEYVSNNDGTHKKFCTECDEITDETCEYNEEGVCIHCGYALEKDELELEYVELEREVDGVTLVITGWMPEGAEVTVRNVSTEFAEYYLEQLGEGEYQIFKAYDINIYDTDGNKYQPQDDGNAIKITVKNVEEVAEVDNSQVEVLRVNPDDTVSKLYTEVSEEDVSFVSEHFSYHFIGTETDDSGIDIAVDDTVAIAGTSTTTYTRINSAFMEVYLYEGDEFSCTVEVKKGVTLDNPIGTGTVVASAVIQDAVTATGWATVSAVIPEESKAWMKENEAYAVVFKNFQYEFKLKSGSKEIYINGDNTLGYNGVVDCTTDQKASPYDITSIDITSTAGKTVTDKTIYYVVGEKDTLKATGTDTSNTTYDLDVEWEIVSGTITFTASGKFEATTPTIAKLKAKFGTVTTEYTIVVYEVRFAGSSSYSATYTGNEIKPVVTLYDGTNEIKEGISTFAVDYVDNQNVGTAAVSVTGANNKYKLSKSFTIGKRPITDFTFPSGTNNADKYTINTSTDVVTDVRGITSTDTSLATPALNTAFTMALSRQGLTSDGIHYNALVTGIGNYSGTISLENIYYKSDLALSDYVNIEWKSVPSKTYTGEEITFTTDQFVYTDNAGNDISLALDITYKDNVSGAETTRMGTVIFKDPNGIYTGTIEKQFYIAQANIQRGEFTATWKDNIKTFTYTGEEIKPEDITITYKSADMTTAKQLVKDTDYRLTYANNVNVGNSAMVNIEGIGNYSGTRTETFTIEGNLLTQAIVYVNSNYSATLDKGWDSGYVADYTGKAISPTVRVYLTGRGDLDNNTDYTYTIVDAEGRTITDSNGTQPDLISAGTKNIIITGKSGNLTGKEITVKYEVSPINVGGSKVLFALSSSVKDNGKTYSGNAEDLEKDDYTITYNGVALTKDKDYTITCANNTDVTNAATYTITGIGNFKGTRTGTYKVSAANIANALVKFRDADNLVLPNTKLVVNYDGTPQTPEVTVSLNGRDMTGNYEVAYSNNVAKSTDTVKGTATVTPKNNLQGSPIVLNFTIDSKSLSGVTVTLNNYSVEYKGQSSNAKEFYYFCSGYAPVYTGGSVVPKNVLVKDGDVELIKSPADGYAYRLSYANRVNVSDYETHKANNDLANAAYVKIEGQNNYAGTTLIIYYNILPRDLADAKITVNNVKFSGNTAPNKPAEDEIRVTYQGKNLIYNVDYEVDFASTEFSEKAKKAGQGNQGIIRGKGSYSGEQSFEYTIGTQLTGTSVTLTNPITDELYNKQDDVYQVDWIGKYYPKVKIENDSATDITDKCTISPAESERPTDAGNTVNITISGDETKGYWGSTVCTYAIKPVSFISNSGRDDRSSIDPTSYVGVSYYKNMEDYKYKYIGKSIDISADNALHGHSLDFTYRVKNSSGTKEFTYALKPADYEFDNNSNIIGPEVGGYNNVVVKGKGNFCDSLTIKGFQIDREDLSKYKVINISSSEEKKSAIVINENLSGGKLFYDANTNTYSANYVNETTPITVDSAITVYNSNGDEMTKDKDYIIKYEGNNKPGKCTVSIIGVENSGYYGGSNPRLGNTEFTYDIKQIDVSNDLEITLKQGYYPYTGIKYDVDIIQPDVTVTYNNKVLTYNTDYTLEVGENTYPGIGKTNNNIFVKVKAKENSVYTGEKIAYFNIYANIGANSMTRDETADKPTMQSVDDNNKPLLKVVLDATSYAVGGDPDATVYYNKTPSAASPEWLPIVNTNKEQYSASASDKTSLGVKSVVVEGKALSSVNSTSAVMGTCTFTGINFKGNIKDYARLINTDFAYTGNEINIDNYVRVDYGVLGEDYTISYAASNDKKSVGEKELIVEATTNSRYFNSIGADRSTSLKYYIKYDLNSDNTVIELIGSNAQLTKVDGEKDTYTTSYAKKKIEYTVSATCNGSQNLVPNYITVTDDGDMEKVGNHPITLTRVADSNAIMGGPRTVTLRITGESIKDATVTLSDDTFAYTGQQITPEVTVTTKDGVTLTKNVDYNVKFINNVSVGTATVNIIGIGAYSESPQPKTFTIEPRSINDTGVTVKVNDAHYYVGQGVPVKPKFEVYFNGKKLTSADYKLSDEPYTSNTGGAYEVTGTESKINIIGQGNFAGERSEAFKIDQLDLSTASVHIADDSTTAEYTGKTITPSIKLTVNDYEDPANTQELKLGIDYKITILDDTQTENTIKDKGIYTVKIGAVENSSCKGERIITYTVTNRSLAKNWKQENNEAKSSSDIVITVDSVEEYDGEAIPASIKVTDAGVDGYSATNPKVLVKGEDYTLEYKNNTTGAEGKYGTETDKYGNYLPDETSPYVIIKGINNYSDATDDCVKVVFNVGKNISDYTITRVSDSYITEYDYDGESHIPDLVITKDGDTLTKDDYEVTVEDSVNAKKEIPITVKGKGKYYGTITDHYRINQRNIGDGYNWTNKYVDAPDNNEEVNVSEKITLQLKDVSTMSMELSRQLYGTEAYAGYYYVGFDKKFATEGFNPQPILIDQGLTSKPELVEGKDYKIIANNNNTNASTVNKTTESQDGLANVQIELMGNYTSPSNVFTIYYIITPSDMTSDAFKVQFAAGSNDIYEYTGSLVKPEIVVSNTSDVKLKEGQDYDVYYSDKEITDGNYASANAPVAPGLGYVYVVGKNSYVGTVSRTYSVKANLSKIVENASGNWEYGAIVTYKDDAKTMIDQAGIKTQFLTGKEIKPANIGLILFKTGGTIANKGYFTVNPTDYSWEYGSNDEVKYTSTGWVQAVGNSTYITSSHTTTYKIELDTSLIDVYIDGVKYEDNKEYPYQFTGADIIPKFTTNYSNIVVDDTKTQYSRTDGTNNKDAEFFVKQGEISARLYFKIDSTGAEIDNYYKDVKYTITGRKLADCTLVMASSQRYTGKQIKPAFTIFIQNSTGQYPLTEGTDYSVAYGTNIAKTGSITLTALPTSDVVVGEKTGTFKINLGTVGGLTATASGDSITAKWVNDIYSDGAVVIVEKVTTASDGTAVYTEVKNQKFNYSTTTHTFTGLESNTNYRVKAYAYENDNNITSTPSFRAVSTGIGGTEFEISNAVAGRLTLTWPTEGEVKIYRIFRGTEADKSSCRMIASYPASTGAFTNSSLTSGQTYYYYLKGYIINSQGVLEQFSESELISETVK